MEKNLLEAEEHKGTLCYRMVTNSNSTKQHWNNFTHATNSILLHTGAAASIATLGFVPNIPMDKDHKDATSHQLHNWDKSLPSTESNE
eukprot:1451420-Amphidinium_carterae.2